jgi:hypothetical protein
MDCPTIRCQIPENAEPVVTNRRPTVFSIESAGDKPQIYVVSLANPLSMWSLLRYVTFYHFKIKVQGADLLWNVEPPVVPRGEVSCFPSRCQLILAIVTCIPSITQIKLRRALLSGLPRRNNDGLMALGRTLVAHGIKYLLY